MFQKRINKTQNLWQHLSTLQLEVGKAAHHTLVNIVYVDHVGKIKEAHDRSFSR